MSLIKRYLINYNLNGGMDGNLIQTYIDEINKIYNMVDEKYNGYMTHKDKPIILSGSAAILYYLYYLGFNDLIIHETFVPPSDVDLLAIYTSKYKPVIDELFIGDFKQINEYKTQPESKKSSATFIDNFSSNYINSFDLTYTSIGAVRWNNVNNVNVIDLKNLLDFYKQDADLLSRQGKDYPKIEIIKQIIQRLESNPNPIIIPVDKSKYLPSRLDFTSPKQPSKKSKLSKNLFNNDDGNADKVFTEKNDLKPMRLFDD